MSSNPLLSKVKLPGRIFQLPSKGLFYEPGKVLDTKTKDGEIQVKPLSALAEMKFRSPDLLFNGRALREICDECIPDIRDAEALISKDVDAIFCFLRIVTYGADMQIKYKHMCNEVENSYHLNLEDIITKSNNESLAHRDLSYSVILSSGEKVNLRPITFKDALDVTHIRLEVERNFDEIKNSSTEFLEKMMIRDTMSGIDSVETEPDESGVRTRINDKVMIEQWVRTLQRKHITEILEQLQRAEEWGYNLLVTFKCKDCNEDFKYALDLNPINFFSG